MTGRPDTGSLKRTPLYDQHVMAGARMVPFAGYEMPVSYPLGVLKEHLHVRKKAGLFDISHMGQISIGCGGPDGQMQVLAALEKLCAASLARLEPGQQRYTQLLNDKGGMIDDIMVWRPDDIMDSNLVHLVVNGANRDKVMHELGERLKKNFFSFEMAQDRVLLALQGPMAVDVLRDCLHEKESPSGFDRLGFMRGTTVEHGFCCGVPVRIIRCGYTGEDGFEISVHERFASFLWEGLLGDGRVEAIGLGARDSLRLEAGLCLYGHDIDETTSPVEANLVWSIGRRRRQEGGFPGQERILRELQEGPARKLVGIRPDGRVPAREGTIIFSADGQETGIVTSGGFGPSVDGPVAMGYVKAAFASPGTALVLEVRGKKLPARVQALPFVRHRYYRKQK